MSMRTKPRKVDFFNHKTDLQVLVYGKLGLSTGFISAKTNLTSSQVQYRLHKRGVKRSDYRNGLGNDLPLVLGAMEIRLSRILREQLASNGRTR